VVHFRKTDQDRLIPETAVRVFRRYLQMFPEHSEQYVDYLAIEFGQTWEHACPPTPTP
jgi:hypothetical protein